MWYTWTSVWGYSLARNTTFVTLPPPLTITTTPFPTTAPPLPHCKPTYYLILNQDNLFFVIVFMIFFQYKMILRIYPHNTLYLSNYFSLKLIWQGGGLRKWGYYYYESCACVSFILSFSPQTHESRYLTICYCSHFIFANN